jgi:hypothetical protein
MHRYQVLAPISLSFGLVLACSDDDPGTGQGQGATSNAGSAGTSSTAAGSNSGGSSSGSSGAAGDSAGGASGMGGSGMGGSDTSSGNVTPEDVCERGCVKTESLNCPMDPADCEAACLAEYLDYPAQCQGLVLAYGDCAADRPASDFLCDEEGEAAPRDGICETESLAAASCLLNAL